MRALCHDCHTRESESHLHSTLDISEEVKAKFENYLFHGQKVPQRKEKKNRLKKKKEKQFVAKWHI